MLVGSCAGSFHAFDADGGEPRWTYDTGQDGNPAQFHGDALLAGDLVVVGSDGRPQGHLYAFDSASGQPRWKLPFPGGVTAQVLRHGDAALAVAVSGEVAAVDLATGTPLWLVEGPEGVAGGRVNDPALADGRLFVAWAAGTVDAYDAATGELLWRRELGAPVNTSAALFGGGVVVGTLEASGGRLVRLSAETGEVTARTDPGGAPYGDLLPAGGCLLSLVAEGGFDPAMATSGGHLLACLEPGLATARWSVSSPDEWTTPRPLVRGDQVVVGAGGRLLGVAVDDGEVLWERAFEGRPRGLGGSGRFLYVGTLAGEVHALAWDVED